MRQKGATDQLIAAIAQRQHGAISSEQLLGTGLSRNGISRRVRDGRLHRMHRGVYSVGHLAPSRRRVWIGAVLACRRGAAADLACPAAGRESAAELDMGDTLSIVEHWGAALSHMSAAQLWGLLPMRKGIVDVSVPGRGGKKKRRGIRIHRPSSLSTAAVTIRDGIPVTTPARTIADLRRLGDRRDAGAVSPRELRRAMRQADVLGLPLGDDVESDRTRSDLEADFIALCRRHRLPAPGVNVRVGPHLVDFLWRTQRLVVETDFYGYHRGLVAFQDDRGRDLDLRRRGFVVIRLSEKQVNEEPDRIAEVLRANLASPPSL